MYGNGQDVKAFIGGGAIGGGGANPGMLAPASIQTPRMPAVTEQVEGLAKRSEHLHSLISQLEDRLSAIVIPQPPDTANAREGRPTPSVALAAGLLELNARLDSACARLNGLLQRIDL